MKDQKISTATIWGCAILSCANISLAAGTAATNAARDTNARAAMTSEQQSQEPADVELTRRIREQLVNQSQLSMNAHNIKVITQNGKVTLKGPVDSAQERVEVERIAKSVAGAGAVVNHTTISK